MGKKKKKFENTHTSLVSKWHHFNVMQPLCYDCVTSRYKVIQNVRQCIVSYHDFNICCIYCQALKFNDITYSMNGASSLHHYWGISKYD